MCLKLTADPERELASIEYWIMGSLNAVSGYSIGGNLALCALCVAALFLLHRQVLLLSADEGEARMLGVSVGRMRLAVLLTATLAVSCVVSLSGLISFVGLLAPHGARLLTKRSGPGTMLLGGLLGGILLTGADILARSVAAVELPVSIFTSLLGRAVPHLPYRERQAAGMSFFCSGKPDRRLRRQAGPGRRLLCGGAGADRGASWGPTGSGKDDAAQGGVRHFAPRRQLHAGGRPAGGAFAPAAGRGGAAISPSAAALPSTSRRWRWC